LSYGEIAVKFALRLTRRANRRAKGSEKQNAEGKKGKKRGWCLPPGNKRTHANRDDSIRKKTTPKKEALEKGLI